MTNRMLMSGGNLKELTIRELTMALTEVQKAVIENFNFPVSERDFPEDRKHENGNYCCICFRCGEQFIGYKRRVRCKVCSGKLKSSK